jgi:ribosomal protein S18 acetylase RimI-like enzyme
MTNPLNEALEAGAAPRGIIYRQGTPADGTALLRVHQRAILKVGVAGYDPETARSWAHGLVAEGYGQCMAKGECFEVAVLDGSGQVVGFCSTMGNEVCSLHVNPDHMRQGIASSLLDRAQARMAEEGHARVCLQASLGAVPFYRRYGFNAVGECSRPSRGGVVVPVVEMEWYLQPGSWF